MKLRGFAISGLLAALALALAGGGDSAQAKKDSSRLALGKTSQGRGMGAKIHERRLRMLDFNALLRCRDGSRLIVEEGGFLPIRTRPNGTFRDVQYGRTDTVWLQGRVGKKWLQGRLRVTDRWGSVKCNSRWFRFKARIRS